MKPGVKTLLREKRFLWQLIIVVALMVLPVFMIFFNGTRTIRSLFWQVPEELNLSANEKNSFSSLHQARRMAVPEFGVFDPENKFRGNRHFSLEQWYVSWADIHETDILEKLSQIASDGRTPVLTIEPWNGSHGESTLLKDITTGHYDIEIDKLIRILTSFEKKIYLIWGHEMDQDLTKRYPWSGKEPEDYIMAYRYVHDRMNQHLPEVEWIWSPVVKKGCDRYWPGGTYVDLIGMPVYSFPQWEKSYYGHMRSFKSWYEEKFNLLRDFGKPVVIVELGVTGSTDYQTYWLQEAFETMLTTPSIEKVIFFHARDTEGSWGENLTTPDWRTDPEILTGLVTWITALE